MQHSRNLSNSSISSHTSFLSLLSIESKDYDDVFAGDRCSDELISNALRIIEENRPQLIKAGKRKYCLEGLLEGMLLHAPCTEGARHVAVVLHIAARKGSDEVINVAKVWLDYLLLPMLTIAKNRQSQPSNRTEQRGFRARLAEREGHRCAISRFLDQDYAASLVRNNTPFPTDVPGTAKMQAAHIIPLNLNNFDDVGQHSTNTGLGEATTTWDMLRSWTLIDLDEIAGSKINSCENGVYMAVEEHADFGAFNFYFEPIPNAPHTYKATYSPNRGRYVFRTLLSVTHVAFNTHTEYPPPNPDYLRIHTAFAQVLHMSGAAEYIDNLWRDADETKVLHDAGAIDIGQALDSQLKLLAVTASTERRACLAAIN